MVSNVKEELIWVLKLYEYETMAGRVHILI